MKDEIKIIITDDQELFRKGLKALLDMEGIHTIAEAGNGKELLHLLEVKRLRPDVILLDLEMPVMNGRRTLAALQEKHPEHNVIILSTFSEGSLHNEYIAKGAKSYLNKSINGHVVAETIRNVLYLKGYSEIRRLPKSIFTELEIQTIPLLLASKTNQEIADHFGVSVKAIEGRRNRLYMKTGCSNRLDFNSYCVREGLSFLGNNN